jgi:hypothetical protein
MRSTACAADAARSSRYSAKPASARRESSSRSPTSCGAAATPRSQSAAASSRSPAPSRIRRCSKRSVGCAPLGVRVHLSYHKECRFAESLQHAERVLALYDPAAHAGLRKWVGQDVAVDAAIVGAFDLWYLGRIAAAQRRIDEAIVFGRRSEHAYSLVFALCYAAAFHLTAEDSARATACADEAMALAEAERLPSHRGFAALMRAAALPRERGRLEAMLAALRGLRLPDPGDASRTTGTTGVRALFVAALVDEGLQDLARAQLAEAFAAVVESGEHHQLPGLHLLRASLAPGPVEAEQQLERALAIATERGLGMASLQAATELARLRAGNGRRNEARALLTGHLARFEGEPEVPLLARARSLAGALASPA